VHDTFGDENQILILFSFSKPEVAPDLVSLVVSG